MRRVVAGPIGVAALQVGRLFSRAGRAFNYLAAGTLNVDGLRAGIERTWEDFNARDVDVDAGLTRWEQEMVSRYVTRDDQVLLVGSGPGRDLIALVADGYRVTAVEPARRAVAACRRHLSTRGLKADLIEGFFEEVTLSGRFDAIIFSGCCYSFIPESRRRIAALRKAANHLTPRGRVLINYMNEQPDHPRLIQLARGVATLTGSDWRPETGDVLLPMNANRPLFNFEHRFAPGELESEAMAAGLRVAQRCDFPNAPVLVLQHATDTV